MAQRWVSKLPVSSEYKIIVDFYLLYVLHSSIKN